MKVSSPETSRISNPRFPVIGLIIFAFIVVIDQISKIWVQSAVSLYQGIPVLGNIFRITYVQNPGGAFSTQFGGSGFYIVVASAAALVVVVYIFLSRERGISLQLSLFAILAGAIGNLIDRVRLGEVIDWIDIGIGSTRWPTFNIADAAIVIGLVVLIFAGSSDARENSQNKGAGGDIPNEAGQLSGRNGTGTEPQPDTETNKTKTNIHPRKGD